MISHHGDHHLVGQREERFVEATGNHEGLLHQRGAFLDEEGIRHQHATEVLGRGFQRRLHRFFAPRCAREHVGIRKGAFVVAGGGQLELLGRQEAMAAGRPSGFRAREGKGHHLVA